MYSTDMDDYWEDLGQKCWGEDGDSSDELFYSMFHLLVAFQVGLLLS